MMQSPKALRVLDVLSGLALLLAVALYVLPINVNVDENSARAVVAGDSAVAPPMSNTVADDNDAATVVAANILSSSRRAPSVRYVSPELMPPADYSMPPAFAASGTADSAKAAGDDADAAPALYGIVNADGTWRALLRLSDSDVSPTLLREGERRGSYVVVSIRPNAVVVAGPSGQRTLRLNRAARNDSTGKSQ